MPQRRMSVALSLLVVVLSGSSLTVAQTVRLGGELQVNTYTIDAQLRPSVEMNGTGAFVVVWESNGQDGSSTGAFVRRFEGSGIALGDEVQANTYTLNGQLNATVGMSTAGAFVVAWESANGQDGNDNGVFARRFNASGAAIGAEIQVNSYTTGSQRSTVAAMDGNGGFVVAWQSAGQDLGGTYGVFARRFNAAGVAQGVEFQVNTFTLYEQSRPAVAMRTDGAFIVAWQSAQDGAGFGVFARRFDSSGAGVGVEFQVNGSTLANERYPAVGVDAAGRFVVSWSGNDGSGYGVFARRFEASGAGVATEFQVSVYTTGSQNFPTVDLESEGGFVITWNSADQDGSGTGVFARRFDAAGVPVASELQVNTYTAGAQQLPGVAMNSGSFVVAWQSAEQDGSGNGVFAQRFATAILDIDGDGETAALTDGLLVLRFLFGFTGPSLTSGAFDPVACTRCSAVSIEGYLKTLI